MQPAPMPQNEQDRLKTVYSYQILDTLPEKDFDDITILASEICQTPIASISIIDADRQWLKSKVGMLSQETPREITFCGHAINKADEILVVPNSEEDERFRDNPLVTGEPHVIFYAGVPLKAEDGNPLGTLCVIDTKPRQLSDSQLKSLKALANQVVTQLELRKKNRELALSRFSLQEINEELEKFAQVVAHDLKSPCNNIIGLSELLLHSNNNHLNHENQEIIRYMSDSAVQLKRLIDDILQYTRTLNFSPGVGEFTFEKLMLELKRMVQLPEQFELISNGPDSRISVSKAPLLQILLNLTTNAIRYNDKTHGLITISFF
ncbi:MAG: GAF domain-containing protein, partial [Flavipsychrobacter sp.]